MFHFFSGGAPQNIFKKASLDLKFAKTKTLLGAKGENLVTFSRASSGTYFDENGVLQVATSNVPRFDHDPTTKESLGLLIEPSRQNVLPFSERQNIMNAFVITARSGPFTQGETLNFSGGGTAIAQTEYQSATLLPASDVSGTTTGTVTGASSGATATVSFQNSMWSTKTNVKSITACPDVDPAGGYNAWTFTKSGSSIGVFGRIITGSTAGYTMSIWIKRRTGSGQIALTVGDSISQNITITNNWVRYSVANVATTTAIRFYITIIGNDNDAIDIYGAQLELTSQSFVWPTSYIPTTTAAVTRSEDIANITGANYTSFASSSDFSLYAEANRQTSIATSTNIASVSDGTANNRMNFRQDSSVLGYVFDVVSGSAEALPSFALNGTESSNKVAFSMATNALDSASNGVLGTPDTSCTIPTNSQLGIGNLANAGYYGGYIRRLTYWPKKLGSSILQKITR